MLKMGKMAVISATFEEIFLTFTALKALCLEFGGNEA